MIISSPLNYYELHLKNFDGPIALLDELIGKSKLDITEISLAQVTGQYLTYLKTMKEFNIELASEFFVIAATLIHSKTRRLLPKISDESDEEMLDEQELLSRLREYRYFKHLARKMEESLDKGSVYFTRGKVLIAFEQSEKKEINELTIGDLFRAVIRYKGAFIRKAIPIKRRFVTVEQKIERLSSLLSIKPKLKFSEILEGEHQKPDKIATFLAIADSTYHQKTIIIQDHLFQDFEVHKKERDDLGG
ncbi:MAG: segregation and condensation protein A [Brevinema sp.]